MSASSLSWPSGTRTLTFSPPPGATDIDGYKWGYSNTIPTGEWKTPSNSATMELEHPVDPPSTNSDFTLYVWAKDAQEGVSAPQITRFTRTAASTKISQYRFDQDAGQQLEDVEARNNLPLGGLPLADRATYDDGTLFDSMLAFDASSDTGGSFQALVLEESFLISALLDPGAQSGTVLGYGDGSEDRVRISVVPDGADVRYRFSMKDASTSQWVHVNSAATDPIESDLKFVMAIYDKVQARIRIVTGTPGNWVDATSAATVTPSAQVSAPRLTLGGATSTGSVSGRWRGHLDDLSVYQTAGTSQTPDNLYREACTSRAWTDPIDGRCQ